MTYDNALNLIIQKQSLGIKPGLSRICELLNKMGNPQQKLILFILLVQTVRVLLRAQLPAQCKKQVIASGFLLPLGLKITVSKLK